MRHHDQQRVGNVSSLATHGLDTLLGVNLGLTRWSHLVRVDVLCSLDTCFNNTKSLGEHRQLGQQVNGSNPLDTGLAISGCKATPTCGIGFTNRFQRPISVPSRPLNPSDVYGFVYEHFGNTVR